jgi:hypothetical protein
MFRSRFTISIPSLAHSVLPTQSCHRISSSTLVITQKLTPHTETTMGSNTSALSVQDLHTLINHVALPPQLPQTEEPDPSRIDKSLLHLLRDAMNTFDLRSSAAWTSVSKMLSTLDKTEQARALNDDSLGARLKDLDAGGECQTGSFRLSTDIP